MLQCFCRELCQSVLDIKSKSKHTTPTVNTRLQQKGKGGKGLKLSTRVRQKAVNDWDEGKK